MGTHIVVVRNEKAKRKFVTLMKEQAHKQGRVDFYMDNNGSLRDGRGNRVVIVTMSELPRKVQGYDISGYTLQVEPHLLDTEVMSLLESRRRE